MTERSAGVGRCGQVLDGVFPARWTPYDMLAESIWLLIG